MQFLAAGIGPLGVPELIIIAFIVVLIFGVGRLPEVGGAVGKGIREFRKATKDEEPGPLTDVISSPDAPTGSVAESTSVICADCGTSNVRGAKFCSSCGHAIGAPVA